MAHLSFLHQIRGSLLYPSASLILKASFVYQVLFHVSGPVPPSLLWLAWFKSFVFNIVQFDKSQLLERIFSMLIRPIFMSAPILPTSERKKGMTKKLKILPRPL